MSGLKGVSEMARQSLLYTRSAMQVASRNLANVNNPSYSRQTIEIIPSVADVVGGFTLRSAISGESLRQIRDDFTDRQYWGQNSLMQQYETEDTLLSQLEGIMPAGNDSGLHVMIENFWQSWDGLANDPESSTARDAVFDAADTMSLTFNRIHKEFVNLQGGIADEIGTALATINDLANQMAHLNSIDTGGNFDITDRRRELVEDLSTWTNIQALIEGTTSAVSVGGLNIVGGVDTFELKMIQSTNSEGVGTISIVVGDANVPVNVESGILGAMLRVYNEDIPKLINGLDSEVIAIANEVNQIHQTGFATDGTTGLNFFAPNVLGSTNLRVDDLIEGDHDLIASSDTLGVSGNSGIARQLSELGEDRIVKNLTVSEFHRSLVSDLGGRIQQSRLLFQSQQKIVNHLELKRQSASGVSMEEEMTEMVQLEQAFIAASKLISAADELVRTLLNIV